ncbi:MAG: hypothetical protein KatS3mg068_1227 [Candidatus Sericytochromatia bacterium]|nr:MAG: hypothetical protein KatS3mg068_1227 [Candidatus Sericytochromatia bacterium]
MLKSHSKLILLLLATLPINSCLISGTFDDILPNNVLEDSDVLIDGKTLRQQINLKVNRIELEENQEVDFTNYIDLSKSIFKTGRISLVIKK